jgi:aerobic-type carbon monoxide dehydrogenase small subunit (CoxS/CutS family)
MSKIVLKVNGAAHTEDVEPSTPLLYVLRNDLGLRGPHFGCGLGQCGACAVIIDGVARRSCVTPVSGVKGEITTLEGLAPAGSLHPMGVSVSSSKTTINVSCRYACPATTRTSSEFTAARDQTTRTHLAAGTS